MIFYVVVIVDTDETDPLWTEMQQDQDPEMVNTVHLEHKSFDSGQESSLLPTPGLGDAMAAAHVDTDSIVQEPGELTESEEEDNDDKLVDQDEGEIPARRNLFSHYVAASWVERVVLDHPPAPELNMATLARTPNA